jgi:anaphase-promoting complex subunit 1
VQAGGASSHAHGGLLLGLGLQGTLAVLSKPDIFDHLSPHHDGVAIGLLLGLAASKMGTEDPNVSKTLRLYLPAVLPSWNLEHDFSTQLQARWGAVLHAPPPSFFVCCLVPLPPQPPFAG